MAEKGKSVFKDGIGMKRLEFLFDGVFAIAMTLLVLEIKLPELEDRTSAPELAQALKHHGRTFFSYILSFVILSGFWIGHNRIYDKLQRISGAALLIHIWLMGTAATFPFCAHLYGRYPNNPLAGLIYFGGILFYILGMLALIITAERQKLFSPAVPAEDVKRLRLRFLKSTGLLIAAYVSLYALGI